MQGHTGTFYNLSFSVDIDFPHPGIYVLSSRIAYFARDLDVAWNGRLPPFPISHNLVDEVVIVSDDKTRMDASFSHDINPCVNSSSNGYIQPPLPLKTVAHDVSEPVGQALNARGVALVHNSGSPVNIEQTEVIMWRFFLAQGSQSIFRHFLYGLRHMQAQLPCTTLPS